jgi:predicted nucleotidyltransferase
MSSDEQFVEEVLQALQECGLEAIIVGSVAALLQGAPIATEDMDILVRDTPRNREKLTQLEARLGHRAVQISPLTRTLRIPTPRAHLDILFDEVSGNLRFERLRARGVQIPLGDFTARVATLEDVIASKEAAGRPKDLAQLPVLRDALSLRRALQEPGAEP